MTVWPVYVGFTTDLGEPDSPDYERGQIFYEMRADQIVGHARVHLPAGEYVAQVFFYSPADRLPVAIIPLAHPLRFATPGVVDVDPITM